MNLRGHPARSRLNLLAAAAAIGVGVYLAVPGSLAYLLIGLVLVLHFGLHGSHGRHQAHGHAGVEQGAGPTARRGGAGQVDRAAPIRPATTPPLPDTAGAVPDPVGNDAAPEHAHGSDGDGHAGHRCC